MTVIGVAYQLSVWISGMYIEVEHVGESDGSLCIMGNNPCMFPSGVDKEQGRINQISDIL